MPYAEFMPEGTPGEASQSLLTGLDAGQSWMQRSQAMKIAKQQASDAAQLAQQNRDHYNLIRPVVIAKGQAEQAQALNELAGTTQMNDLLASAQTQMPILRKNWTDTYQITDPQERLTAQEQILGNADRFASLKGTGDEVKQWHDVWAQGHLNQRAKDQVTGRSEVANARIDGLMAQLQQKQAHDLELKKITDDFTQQQKDRDAQHAKELEAAKATAAVATAGAKIQSAGAYKENQKLVDDGVSSLPALQQLKTAIALLDDPDVRTGTGAEFQVKAERLGNALGADFKGVAKTEQLQSIIGQSILTRAKAFGNRITNRDLAFLENMSATVGHSAEGNKVLLSTLEKAVENSVNKAKMVTDLRGQGEPEPAINQAVNDFDLHNAIWATTPAAATKPATSGFTADKEQRLQELRAKLGK